MANVPKSSQAYEAWIASVLVLLGLPLLPLAYEFWDRQGAIKDTSLTLMAAMYSITVGAGSIWRPFLLLSIAISVLASIAYGAAEHGAPPPQNGMWACIAIGLVFAIHAIERYTLHVLGGKIFEFGGAAR